MRRDRRPAPTPCRTSEWIGADHANDLSSPRRIQAAAKRTTIIPKTKAVLPPAALVALALTVLMGLSQLAAAGAVYKIMDSNGRVTYSASPPPDGGQSVQELKIQGAKEEAMPAPEESGAVRQENRARELAQAQQQLIRAKATLEQAKIQGPDDWQVQQGGKRVLSATYMSRVAAAESEVETAERALEEVRRRP